MGARFAGRSGESVGLGAARVRRPIAAAAEAAALVLALAALAPAALAPAAPALSAAVKAHAARAFYLNDSGHLHLTSHHGFTLNEQGGASGTISGPLYIHLHVVSTNHVTAEVNFYPHGGSMTGYASAGYHPSGGVATFNGSMNIARGSGRYGHARGSGLSFSGTIQRSNDAVTVHVSGHMSA